MKGFKKIARSVLCFSLAMSMMIPTSITSFAEEATVDFEIESANTFVPFRDQIPYYLSVNSSMESEIVQEIWAKVFWEEKSDPSIYVKHSVGYDTEANKTVAFTYTGLGGVTKQLSSKITYSTGDFEAFFGNSIAANPKFLGRMLGLSGYDKLGSNSSANAYMNTVVGVYMLDPDKYIYFAKDMAELTADGTYLDGSLKGASTNGVRADYAMLATLASMYKQTDDHGNSYLNSTQESWIETYQLELYDAYTTNTNATLKNLVAKYPALLDSIRRSKYAADNRNGWGQTFFDQVVASGHGAGDWLNLITGVNIPSIVGTDDLASVFANSQGFCGGNHRVGTCPCRHIHENGYSDTNATEKCWNATNCKENATIYDIQAYDMYSSSEKVRNYLLGNSTINQKLGTHWRRSGTWMYKFHAKHQAKGPSPNPIPPIPGPIPEIKSSGRVSCTATTDWEGAGMKTANGTAYITLKLKDILYNPATGKGSDNPEKVTINVNFEGCGNQYLYSKKDNPANERDDSTRDEYKCSYSYSNNVIPLTTAVMGWAQYCTKSYTFDVSNCEIEDLENGYIQVTTGYSCSAYNGNYTSYANCTVGECTIIGQPDTCDREGHRYNADGNAQWHVASADANGIKTYDKIAVKYNCEGSKKHTVQATFPVTSIIRDGTKITYKAVGRNGESYTKIVNTASSGATITNKVVFNGTNTTGTYTNSNYSSEVIWPSGGNASYRHNMTQCSCTINGTLKGGNIPFGAKTLVFHFDYGTQLESLTINVMTKDGKRIGYGSMQSASTINYNDRTITVNLLRNSDSALDGAYVQFSGKASDEHHNSGYWDTASPSSSHINITSMDIYY